ncbi:MAG: LacI family DNA-binding transcriptional regulator [Deinococcota bacterium]
MVRLEDVANRAGVSVSTVSRALTRPEMVTPKTRKRVLEAAQALGYAPNQLARSLRKQGSRTLGLIISDILVPFHAEVAKGVEDVASKHGFATILCNSGEDPKEEARYLEVLRGFQVGGIIIEPTRGGSSGIEALVKSGTRVVEVDRISGARGVTSVLSDNLGGARMAAEYLYQLGHRHFAVIAGDTGITSGKERLQGFREALERQSVTLEPRWVYGCANTPLGGYEAARRLFAQSPLPTALFVQNAQMMSGVLRAVREVGLEIPRQLSVVCFDETQWTPLVSPALTVVAQQAYELGRTAAERIVKSMEKPSTRQKSRVVRLPTQLVVRESCGRPREREEVRETT